MCVPVCVRTCECTEGRHDVLQSCLCTTPRTLRARRPGSAHFRRERHLRVYTLYVLVRFACACRGCVHSTQGVPGSLGKTDPGRSRGRGVSRSVASLASRSLVGWDRYGPPLSSTWEPRGSRVLSHCRVPVDRSPGCSKFGFGPRSGPPETHRFRPPPVRYQGPSREESGDLRPNRDPGDGGGRGRGGRVRGAGGVRSPGGTLVAHQSSCAKTRGVPAWG